MFNLVDYFDVWQDEEGMYSVNNQCIWNEKPFYIPDHFTDKQILKILKEIGYLKKHISTRIIDIEWLSDNMIEVTQHKNGCPICLLQGVD